MAAADGLDAMVAWYTARCDGEWEHSFGLTLETLDNPGWQLRADVPKGFALPAVEPQKARAGDADDWVEHAIRAGRNGTPELVIAGGPRNLRDVLARFAELAPLLGRPPG